MRRPPVLAAVAALSVPLLAACGGGNPQAQRWDGSTLSSTYVDRNGDGVLERGPREPLLRRTALAPASPAGRTLASFAQITDAHVTDEESPARLEMLDRMGPPYTSAFRPQESLTAQVLAATVTSLDAERPSAVVVTGDLIDNAQQNELAWATRILDGGRVTPASGSRAYQGVQAQANADLFYYRPDVDPPRHPGLLGAAQRPFVSPGLRAPWYPVVGNHDLLVQGNLAPTRTTNAIAVGSRKLVRLDAAALAAVRGRQLSPRVVASLLAGGLPGAAMPVAHDAGRRELSASQVLATLRRASGHGGSGRLMDYSFDLGLQVRAIVLDLARRSGGAGGVVHPGQASWLGRQLRAAGHRWVVVFSHMPLQGVDGGERLLALLDRDPRVVAAIAGDTHRNAIAPRRRRAGGYWLITTASLVDYPQQARMFRLRQTRDGVVLDTWMVEPDPANRLASLSRSLSFLDYQGGRPRGLAGSPADRNASLYLRSR